MSDIMKQIPIKDLISWIFEEYENEGKIFSITKDKFFAKQNKSGIKLFGEVAETPIGPAAGPHTQLTQNIVVSYLTGSRFFEIKTVQILDKLEFEKPCIEPMDECYNTEWSTELAIGRWAQEDWEIADGRGNAFDEYVKAWFLLHLLQKKLGLSKSDKRGFIFNMSVGYNLEGIKTDKVDRFIEGLKDASSSEIFAECKEALIEANIPGIDKEFVDGISSSVCNSITLSTMHGCPPDEIEKIAKYLISEKKINTFVKLNPTLMGYDFVRDTFDRLGFGSIVLSRDSFEHDLQYSDAVPMVRRLKDFAIQHNQEFGVKLSNTLAVVNSKSYLPGAEMYMSGRTLFAVTINLAAKLAREFEGDLKVSYSGGATFFNAKDLFSAGIRPITLATDVLKPGGYSRFKQIAESLEDILNNSGYKKLDVGKIEKMAKDVFVSKYYNKKMHTISDERKIKDKLPFTDCFVDPCSSQCPINQDIPEYLELVAKGEYESALKVILAKNPLPFMTGILCPHSCTTKCTRLEYEDYLRIREIKKIAADGGFEKVVDTLQKGSCDSKSKVAIIGAGPAGVACGFFLGRQGLDVTVFEREKRAGGIVQSVIPDFRISDEDIQKDVELAKRVGVKFVFDTESELDIEHLREEGFRYVVVAIGVTIHTFVNLDGGKSLNAVQFLYDYKNNRDSLDLGENVAIIGGGDTAMDAARAAKRLAKNSYIVYRRTKDQMPAEPEELELALSDNVEFKNLLSPISFDGKTLVCEKMKLGALDASGRARPVGTGQMERLKIDTVISSIGEKADTKLLEKRGITKIINPDTLETDVRGVYLAGDLFSGGATIVDAIADAAKVAKSIMFKEGMVGYEDKFEIDLEQDKKEQKRRIVQTQGVLIENQEGKDEGNRCLECNVICNLCSQVCPNRANVQIVVDGMQDPNQIVHIDGMCNECGNCGFFCPYIGDPYKDKPTLFWSEADFANSGNEGFLLCTDNGKGATFKVKAKGVVDFVSFDKQGKTEAKISKELAAIIWTTYKNYRYMYL